MDSLNKREHDNSYNNKEGIDFAFEQNPELLQIGSKEEYSEYTNTIYNNHQLVYRGDTLDLEYFHYSDQIRKKGSLTMNYLKFGSGIYLTDNKLMADKFAQQNNGKLYYCFIKQDKIITFNNREDYDNNIKNFYNIERVTTLDRDNYTKHLHYQNKILHIKDNGDGNEEFIGDMKNIHILGSQQDIEGFKQFIEQRNTKIEHQLIENLKINF